MVIVSQNLSFEGIPSSRAMRRKGMSSFYIWRCFIALFFARRDAHCDFGFLFFRRFCKRLPMIDSHFSVIEERMDLKWK
jgi:hypothetical protein